MLRRCREPSSTLPATSGSASSVTASWISGYGGGRTDTKHLPTGYHGPRWAAWELALLGTVPDREVARRTGRSVAGVRQKRMKLGIANPHDGRRTKKRRRGSKSEPWGG